MNTYNKMDNTGTQQPQISAPQPNDQPIDQMPQNPSWQIPTATPTAPVISPSVPQVATPEPSPWKSTPIQNPQPSIEGTQMSSWQTPSTQQDLNTQQVTQPIEPSTPTIQAPWQTIAAPTTTVGQAPVSSSPWQSTPVASTTPSASTPWQEQTETTSTNEAPTSQPSVTQEAPLITPKKKVPPVILGALTMFVIVAIAGGTFLLSRGVSSTAPVAPNAPSSQPKAFDPNEEAGIKVPTSTVSAQKEPFDPNGTIDCSNVPSSMPYGNRCLKVLKYPDGSVDWAPGELESLM